MKRIVFFIAFLFLHWTSRAQELRFNQLMTRNGLSQNSIFAIAQDSRGFMWYGSRFGLNRYDGHGFRLYKSIASDSTTLSDDYILSIYCDAQKTLWVGTSNGLNKFNPILNSFERIYLPGGVHAITCIYQDKSGKLWAGSSKGLYQLRDRDHNVFVPAWKTGIPGNITATEILSLFEDDQGQLWIGTNKGLACIAKNRGAVKLFTSNNNNNSISDNAVTAIVQDKQQNLWFGTETGGLNLFQKKDQSFTRFQHTEGTGGGIVHNAIRKMIIDRHGELWIGTQEGLSILQPQSRTFRSFQHRKANNQSLNQNSIYSLYEDRNGSVWIGTYYGGVNVRYAFATNFKTWQYDEKQPGLNHNVISSIVSDQDDNLWIGTEGGGLSHFNKNTKAFRAYNYSHGDAGSLGSNLVKILYRDKENHLWIGTHGGDLNLFNPANQHFVHYRTQGEKGSSTRSEIVALLEDHKGALWVGSQTGLKIFKKSGAELSPSPQIPAVKNLSSKNIKVLFEDSRKNIWIATTAGLYQYIPGAASLLYFKLSQGSNSVNNNANYINCIQEDSKGNIWVGLYYGGLSKYELQFKTFRKPYTVKDGLANNNVLGILEDGQQQLWISTSNGLSKFDPQRHVFQTYTTSDGLSSDEFNYNSFFKATDGTMYFGGFNGLTYFQPEEIGKNSFKAPMVFTGLRLFNEPIGIRSREQLLDRDIGFTKKLVFKHDQNIFSIEFALLNYIKAGKNKYAYKLEGINEEWIESHTPAATYTNLPAGSYTFLVKGANNDGVWSSPIQMQIEISPPLWKTWWAYGLYAVLLAVVIFFITRFFYLRGLLRKDEELHQIKLNFFTNISHEIRTHLTLIMAPVEKLMDNQKDPKAIEQLKGIKNNADRLLKLVSELMDFRKADTKNLKLKVAQYDLVPFIQDIYNSFKELSVKKQIGFTFEHPGQTVLLYFDSEQLEKVFFNLLSNAFKFTPDHGKITIVVYQQAEEVQVHIVDTGRGISPEYLDQLFVNYFQVDDHSIQNTGYGIGLALSRHIIELHKGKIEVKSETARGQQHGHTCFNICLRSGKQHFSEDQLRAQPHPLKPFIIPLIESEPTSDLEIAPKSTKDYTIQIVEDHTGLQQLIRESLEQDYHILLSSNGKQGWDMAVSEIPDLIISDVMMPEMDGFTLCDQLKKDERTDHIPVLLLTAKTEQNDQITGLSRGADVYLTKPFSVKVLQLQVHNLMQAREKLRRKYSKGFIPEPNPLEPDQAGEQFLSRMVLLIEQHMEDEDFGVEMLAEKTGMSLPVLYKKLKALTGLSVNDFSKTIRLKKAAQLLLQKKYTVYEVGYMVGFSDRKYFSREFKKQFGKTPTDYIQ
jgi:ligand-binding sensor domain-containing protein/signal transduction histidine kinase/DNA-binding NarL/FixJ family response regulator